MSGPFDDDTADTAGIVGSGADATPSLPSAATAPDDFQRDLDEFSTTEPAPPDPAEPQNLQEYMAHARSLGFTDDEARSIMPAEFRTQEELNNARDALHGQYSRGLEHLRSVAERISLERDRQDATRLVETLRKDFPNMSEDRIKEKLHARDNSSARFRAAWDNRYRDKATWTREANRVGFELAEEQRAAVDWGMTETKNAIAAAVTRSSLSGPRDEAMPNLSKMSDTEFARWQKERFGY